MTAPILPHRPSLLAGPALAVGMALSMPVVAAELQRVDIVDVGGFSEPTLAARVEVPADWRTQGDVTWNHATNCITNKVRIEWRARSRDDSQGFEIMPGYSWQLQGTQNQMNPCPAQPFRSAQQFLEAVAQQRRAGARVLQYRDRPEETAARTGQAQQGNVRFDAGQVLIAYQSAGVEFREVIGATVTFTEMRGNVVGGVPMVFAQRAPNGSLDFATADRMARSFRYDPAWAERMVASLKSSESRFSSDQSRAIADWHAREMARINAQGAADRAAIRAATSRDVAKINADTYANTQTTNDNIQRRTLEGIGSYNTYGGDGGTTVRSSIHGGERVLSNGNNTYFSTNDPYFNPSGSRELQRVR